MSADPLRALVEELADRAEPPAAATAEDERWPRRGAAPEAAAAGTEHGRLAELAQWWAGVRPPEHSGAPERVSQLILPAQDCPAELPAAFSWGAARAEAAADSGVELLVLRVGDAQASGVLAAGLLHLDAVETVGWPRDTGLDDRSWMAQVAAVRDGLRSLRGSGARPSDLLTALGSPQMAAAVGSALAAAARRTPVLLDGLPAAIAALAARRAARPAAGWWLPADADPSPLAAKVYAGLGVEPATGFGIRALDGTAGAVALAVLRIAADLPQPQ